MVVVRYGRCLGVYYDGFQEMLDAIEVQGTELRPSSAYDQSIGTPLRQYKPSHSLVRGASPTLGRPKPAVATWLLLDTADAYVLEAQGAQAS